MYQGLEVREACCVAFRDIQMAQSGWSMGFKPGYDKKMIGQVTRGHIIGSNAWCIVGAQ